MELPWSTIDMDFMNLNQAAHGDREFGYIQSRLGVPRKTVAGHVDSPARRAAHRRTGPAPRWAATSCAASSSPASATTCATSPSPRATRSRRSAASASRSTPTASTTSSRSSTRSATTTIDKLVTEYADTYRVAPELLPGGERHESLRYGARIELGLRSFLTERRLRRLHDELRGPRRPAPAARPGRAAADGRRLRLRRRGRLEDLGAAARHEGDGRGPARRHVLHGGLHVPPGPRAGEDPRRPHARGLPDHHHPDRRRSRSTRSPSAAARTPYGCASPPTPAAPSSPASPTWATGSA